MNTLHETYTPVTTGENAVHLGSAGPRLTPIQYYLVDDWVWCRTSATQEGRVCKADEWPDHRMTLHGWQSGEGTPPMKEDHDPNGLDGIDIRRAKRIMRTAPTRLDAIRELRMQLEISALNAQKLYAHYRLGTPSSLA